MQAWASDTSQNEVMISVRGSVPVHGRIVNRLTKVDADGAPMFLVVDDSGMSHIVRDADILRLTTAPILRAEHYISAAISNLAIRYPGNDAEDAEWIVACVKDLNSALYELSKPEATKEAP